GIRPLSTVSVFSFTCVGSPTWTSLMGARKPRSHEPTCGSRMPSSVDLTSSAVSGSPLWKLVPPAKVIRRLVLPSVHSKDFASFGLTSKVVGSWYDNWSYTFSLMTFQTFSVPTQGCRVLISTDWLMVRVPPALGWVVAGA